jgi:hypothetical protein
LHIDIQNWIDDATLVHLFSMEGGRRRGGEEERRDHSPGWISDQLAGRVAIQSCIAGHGHAQHSF